MASTTFKGYAVTDWSDFEVIEYPAKNWEDSDIEIEISHCGVCGSDVHSLSGWGGFEAPLVVG